MKSGTSSAEFTGDTILNELYINPYLYSAEQFLRAEEAGESGVSTEISTNSLHKRPQKLLLRSFLRAEVTPAMACANLSLREAELKCPHLLAYL